MKYLDPHELTKGNPIETVTLSSTEYASHYAPEVADTVTSVLHIKRNPGRIMMFSLEFRQPAPNTWSWFDYRWDYACGETARHDQKDGKLRRPADLRNSCDA